MKRLFIGIPIVSENVVRLTESWKNDEQLNRNVIQWGNRLNWHITLVFLGNTPEDSIPLIQDLLVQSFAKVQAFRANLKGMGVFPDSNKPKVLWIGLAGLGELIAAQTGLAASLKQHDFSFDAKPFKPHLTLARIKHSVNRPIVDSLIDRYRNFDFGSVPIDQIILYESILTPDGPVYQPMFKSNLG
jgi:2'-5' RNA ligase